MHSCRAFLVTIALAALVRPSYSDPIPGFLETWSGTSLQGWTGGATYSNPGTGGFEGAGDGFLIMSTPMPGRMAVFCSEPEYAGNWRAAGITSVHVWLDDVNTDDPLQIHFVIGSGGNFWLYNPGFTPPEHAWGEFIVDIGSAANFTRIIGAGTFEDALAAVDRIQFRHDLPPFGQSPDLIQGDVGIDHLLLVGPTTGARLTTWGRIKALYR